MFGAYRMFISPVEVCTLLVLGLVAGIINTLAGGGSNLTVPALMVFGMPPEIANATNRVGVFLQVADAADDLVGGPGKVRLLGCDMGVHLALVALVSRGQGDALGIAPLRIAPRWNILVEAEIERSLILFGGDMPASDMDGVIAGVGQGP